MQIFQISVVSVGQWDVYTVRTRARTSVIDLHSINPYQHLQQTNNTCSKLNYTVFSLSQELNIQLRPEGSPCSNCSSQTLNYLVYLHQTCPPGFNISESERSCVCEPRLAQYSYTSMQYYKWIRANNMWFKSTLLGWIWYSISYTNSPPTSPIWLLCYWCEGLSFLVLVCKLTVARGTLSGLVFYANIVGSNHTIFLQGECTGASCIAWLNLDFGIETCFYNGMDAYS